MAVASVPTQIPLDRAAAILGIDPYHFNGIETNNHRVTSSCDDVWFQYDWQTAGKISRETLAEALNQAESITQRELGWAILPTWIEEEHDIPRYYRREHSNWMNPLALSKSITTSWGKVVELGNKTKTLIDTPTIVYTDEDGDGYAETATVTFATTVTDEQELRVYYPDKSGDDSWEIRPLKSRSISAGTATLVFKRYQVPLETLIEKMSSDETLTIDGEVLSNFLEEVDVYRVYSDPSTQLTFYFEPYNCTPPCDYTTASGCGFIRDGRLGVVTYDRADWDADTLAYTRKSFTSRPNKAKIYYRAGNQAQGVTWANVEVDRTLERMVTYYALTFLDKELCGCSNTKNIWHHMTTDLAVQGVNDINYTMHWDELRNPFGTTRAALTLWKHVQKLRLHKSPDTLI